MDAGQLVRETRRRHRLDQRTLARRAGTSQAQIGRIERGQISPTVSTLARLLAAMGERLELGTSPMRPNQSPTELRADLEGLSAADRVVQAAHLSEVLTTLATLGPLGPRFTELLALELVRVLNAHGVDFVVIGTFAVAAHGYVRGTDDVDVVPRPHRENLDRLLSALVELEAEPLRAADSPPAELPTAFAKHPTWSFRTTLGRLDVIGPTRHLNYERLRERAVEETIAEAGGSVWFASRDDLIAAKSFAGRPLDLIDVRALDEAAGLLHELP